MRDDDVDTEIVGSIETVSENVSSISKTFAYPNGEADDFDHEAAGGWLAGHDAASQICDCSPEPKRLFQACEAALSAQTAPNGRLELIAESRVDVAVGLRLLQSFLGGLRAGQSHGNISS